MSVELQADGVVEWVPLPTSSCHQKVLLVLYDSSFYAPLDTGDDIVFSSSDF